VTVRSIAPQMNEGFIFWQQALRATGPGSPATAISRLSSLLAAGRFGGGNRLAGVMDGSRFRVWRTSTLTTEVVECAGVIRAHGEGSIIEGTLRYKLATRIQFAGGLLLGTVLAIGGALQNLADAQPKSELAPVGLFILAAILVWIYSSSKMKKEQIRYITERLEEIVAT
jgi:hypothetical protein